MVRDAIEAYKENGGRMGKVKSYQIDKYGEIHISECDEDEETTLFLEFHAERFNLLLKEDWKDEIGGDSNIDDFFIIDGDDEL